MDQIRGPNRNGIRKTKGRPLTLALAMILDAILGEPKWLWSRLPHPVVLIGNAISYAAKRWNHGQNRRLKGIVVLIVLVLVSGLSGWFIAKLGWIAEVGFAAILIAQRSLSDHVRAVSEALKKSLTDGRASVAMIVGRDTADMAQDDVARAAIESAAENFSDGVVAPIFWFAVLGLPGILIYKAVNTADSMIGYQTDEFKEFGWASARFDDLINLIPARLTALVMAVTFGMSDWHLAMAEARAHRSPNAGWPEAVMARVTRTALAGPRRYHGELKHYEWVNPAGKRKPGPKDIDQSVIVIWATWGGFLALATGFGLLGWLPILW